jgi:hypothetical protein
MHKTRWAALEIRQLLTRYPKEGSAGLAKDLGRSVDSVTSQATRLDLKSANRRSGQASSKRRRQAAIWPNRLAALQSQVAASTVPAARFPEVQEGADARTSRTKEMAAVTT